METQTTLEDFIAFAKEEGWDWTEIEIRNAIDRLAFWVARTSDKEQFIVHRYLYFLSVKFNFEIDTNVDSR